MCMKIFFEKTFIQNEYVSFIVPLLWVPNFAIWGEDKKQIIDRHIAGQKLLLFSNKKDCDYFIYPKYFLLDNFNELKFYSDDAKLYGKKVIVFSYGEIDDYININDNILWYKRSTRNINPNNEFCLPPFPEDLLPHRNNIIKPISDWMNKKYSIGYTWYSKYYNIRSFLYYIGVRLVWSIFRIGFLKALLMKIKDEKLYWRLVNAGTWNYCRGETINQIQKLKKYDFYFIQRNHALTTDTKSVMREQYIKNLYDVDFPLVVRWFGNYSFRFYEVLSLWKIPLYIDTWAKLPFEGEILYEEFCIIVPIDYINKIGHYIDNYIDKNGWKLYEIQKKVRYIYEQYFTMTNYYTKIIHTLTPNF